MSGTEFIQGCEDLLSNLSACEAAAKIQEITLSGLLSLYSVFRASIYKRLASVYVIFVGIGLFEYDDGID